MFTPYKASLNPDTMSAALEAFESAWAEVMAQPDGYDVPEARDLLATWIIEAALENGECDPERMKDYALAKMTPHQQA